MAPNPIWPVPLIWPGLLIERHPCYLLWSSESGEVEMDAVVIQEQYALIEKLAAQIEMVGSKLEEQNLLGQHTLEEERPPHY